LLALAALFAFVAAVPWLRVGRPPLPELTLVAGSVVVLATSPWWLGPLKARRMYRFRAAPEFTLFDLDDPDTPPDIADIVQAGAADLAPEGFVPRAHFWELSEGPRGATFLSLFENRAARTLAKLATFHVRLKGGCKRTVALVFITEFADGTELATSGADMLRVYPPLKGRTIVQVPGADAHRLYAVHRALLERCRSAAEKRLPLDPDPVAYQCAYVARELAHNARAGYLELAPGGEYYRLTWKAAVLTFWGQFWPVGPLRRALRRRRTAALLRTLKMDEEGSAART
jgi:hypothetical protein